MRTTVGPLPAEVYWRRRLVVLAVLVVALVTIRAYAGGDSSKAGRTPQATPSASSRPNGTAGHPFLPGTGTAPTPTPSVSVSPRPTPSASPSSGPPAITACSDAGLRLTVRSDTRTYLVGAKPKLTMTVRNLGPQDCRRDLGASARALVITSGAAHTWSSADCQRRPAPEVALIKAGTAQTYAMAWSGQRTPTSCTGPAVAATAGTYRLQARLGTLHSDLSVFTLR